MPETLGDHALSSSSDLCSKTIELLETELDKVCRSPTEKQWAVIALKGALIQSFYNVADLGSVIDLIRYDPALQNFVGSPAEIDAQAYGLGYRTLLEEGIIAKFLQDVAKGLEESADSRQLGLANKILRWANHHSPAKVYFNECGNSPIKKVKFGIYFDGKSGPHSLSEFGHLVKPLFPVGGSGYPSGYETHSFRGSEGESIDLRHSSHRYSKDGVYSTWLAHNLESYYGAEAGIEIQFRRQGAAYDGWSETRRHLEIIASACNAICPRAKANIGLSFINILTDIPLNEMSDYFNLMPPPPPKLLLAKKFQHDGLSYEFPVHSKEIKMHLNYKSADNDEVYMSQSLTGPGPFATSELNWKHLLEPDDNVVGDMKLAIRASQHEVVVGELMPAVDGLKDRIYAGFHSAITDRVRRLLTQTQGGE